MVSLFPFVFLCVHCAATFQQLPNELKKSIYDQLSKADVIKSVLTLNNETYRDFIEEHQAEIKSIQQIEFMLRFEHTQEINRNLLGNLTKDLQLSELYALRLPCLLMIIADRHGDSDDILSTMNVRTVSFNQIDAMILDDASQEINFMLKLLVLSSRSLAPFSWTERGIVRWFYKTKIGTISSIASNYPWLVCPSCDDMVHKLYFYHIYKYLFERYHKLLKIPELHQIYIDDGSLERQRLIHLIDEHGLVPWHELTLDLIKSKQPELNNCMHIVKMHKIYERLFALLPGEDERAKQKSKRLMLDILTHVFENEFRNVSRITSELINDYPVRGYHGLPNYATETLTQLARWNYQSGNHDSFEKLIWISSKICNNETGVDFEYLLERERRKSINATMAP